MKNVFDAAVVAELGSRIDALTPSTQPKWGKMSVDQMLAHVNVSYEMVYENKHKRPNPVMRIIIKAFVKNTVVGSKPYRRNSPTAPAFRMSGTKNFTLEKQRLLDFLNRVQTDGTKTFEGRDSFSFGPLKASEWNVLFYKHIDHHLTQFGV